MTMKTVYGLKIFVDNTLNMERDCIYRELDNWMNTDD